MTKSSDKFDWKRLEVDKPRGEAYVACVAFPGTSEYVLAGMDSSGGRHFLVPISKEDDLKPDNQSRGIMVTVKNLHIKGDLNGQSINRYIDVSLKEESESGLFDIIGYQIAELLRSKDRSRSASVKFVLAKWRHFWGNVSTNLLTKDEIVGLFSELWFISRWILPIYHDNLLKGWRGPYGGRHDFEWKGISVEVKGTTTVDGIRHWVNGLDQLSEPENGKLYLFSLKLREEEGATNTLLSVIRSCIDSIQDDMELQEFMERSLALAGYSPSHDDVYDKVKFRVVDEALYAVKDRFPRITPDSFIGERPEGVERVEYQINLEGYNDLIVTKVPWKDLFKTDISQ